MDIVFDKAMLHDGALAYANSSALSTRDVDGSSLPPGFLEMFGGGDIEATVLSLFGNFPALRPPPGQKLELYNPPSRDAMFIAVMTVCLFLATVFVAMRTYTKSRITKTGLALEDFSYGLFIAYIGLFARQMQFGIGTPVWDVTIYRAVHCLWYNGVLDELVTVIFCSCKAALLLSYMKIFAPAQRNTTWYICLASILFNVMFYIAALFTTIFACTPRNKAWVPVIPGHCINVISMYIVTASINLFTDLVILIVPLVCVWRLQMSKRRKRGVTFVLGCGLFGCACSLMRLIASTQIGTSVDPFVAIADQELWSLGEITAAIVTSCMLSAPQFLKATFPTTFGSSSAKSDPSRPSGGIKSVAPRIMLSLPQSWRLRSALPSSWYTTTFRSDQSTLMTCDSEKSPQTTIHVSEKFGSSITSAKDSNTNLQSAASDSTTGVAKAWA